MNILDLAFKYNIDIEHDGDFDGGCYHVKMNYLTGTHMDVSDTEEKIVLKQTDMYELFHGAKKLVKLLEKHVMEDN
jgi:hypothetical protein